MRSRTIFYDSRCQHNHMEQGLLCLPFDDICSERGYLLKPLDDYSISLMLKYTDARMKIQETMWPEDERLNHPIQYYR